MIEVIYDRYLRGGGVVTTDSRNCPEGSVFFALKGENFNGNKYALGALEAGCSCAVVDEAEYAIDDRFVLVDDVLSALQALAKHHRIVLGKPIIGITGTNGKTTTKELVAAVLKEKYAIHYTQGNLNNHIGVPLTLLQMREEHEIVIVEMGANHPGEIKTLVEIACPNVALITNVGMAHLEGFGSLEGVMRTKKEMYDFVAVAGGFIFRNADNEKLAAMAGEIPARLYSLTDEQVEVYGQVAERSTMLAMRVRMGDEWMDVQTHLIGAYNAENVLAAVAMGYAFGLTLDEVKRGLEGYVPQNNRSMLMDTGKNRVVVDAYNANPTSMRAAIGNFLSMGYAHGVMILGDMLELGDQSAAAHAEVVALLEAQDAVNVLLVGSCFMGCESRFKQFATVDDLNAYLQGNSIEGCDVLVKGSRGVRLERVVEYL